MDHLRLHYRREGVKVLLLFADVGKEGWYSQFGFRVVRDYDVHDRDFTQEWGFTPSINSTLMRWEVPD